MFIQVIYVVFETQDYPWPQVDRTTEASVYTVHMYTSRGMQSMLIGCTKQMNGISIKHMYTGDQIKNITLMFLAFLR